MSNQKEETNREMSNHREESIKPNQT